jgi:uncharacterized protein YggE
MARFASVPLLCALVFVAAPAAAQEASPATVTVGGEGTATAVPDRAVVRFGVVTRAPTPEAARRGNATASRDALNAVRVLGVPDTQLRMERLQLQPRYEYSDEKNRRELRGYTAIRTVVAEVDSLGVLPQLVANVVEEGANRLDAIDYQLRDRAPLRNEALQKAARAAHEKAQLLSETLGAALGPVRTITEQKFDIVRPTPQTRSVQMATKATSARAEPEAYAAGEIEVSAQVRVVFDLRTD